MISTPMLIRTELPGTKNSGFFILADKTYHQGIDESLFAVDTLYPKPLQIPIYNI
jgi:hypothetical protein